MAVVVRPMGLPLGFDEKPKPGTEGTTTSKASSRRAAKTGGIGQWSDRFKELEDGARPAVGKDQRNGLRPASLHMIKVNIEIADSREKLRVAI